MVRCPGHPKAERAGGEADLAFQVPAGPAVLERGAGLLPGQDAAVEQVQVGHAGLGEDQFGLRGAVAGAADQHHLVQVAADLLAVFAQQVQRHVVRAGDVRGLELRRGAYVQQAWALAGGLVGGHPVPDGGRVQSGWAGLGGHETPFRNVDNR